MTPEEVPGRLSGEAGHVLHELAREVPQDCTIVEIGAYLGRSTCFLAAGSKAGNGGLVVSIDAWDLDGNTSGPKRARGIYTKPSNYDQYLSHLAMCGVRDLVRPVRSFSSDAPLPVPPVGLLFIDAGHDYNSVKADIDRFVPTVQSGGTIVFDDWGTHCPGVDRAVRELRRANPGWLWQPRANRLMLATKRES